MSKFYQDFPCLAKCCLAFFGAMPNPSLGCFLLVGCCLSCLFFFAFFWGAMPNPSLGCFLLVGCCLSCLGSFVAFFGGRCQIPRLGVSCSSGAAFRVEVLFWPFFGGDAKSLAWVFLARRVLTKWMVMGSVYLELFGTKPCCILVCPIIPYALCNTIL